MGFASPEGYFHKTLAGFAAAPIPVASYIPAIRGVKALGTLGKVGQFAAKRSLPLGLAVTDVAREIDDGSAFEHGYFLVWYGLQILSYLIILITI